MNKPIPKHVWINPEIWNRAKIAAIRSGLELTTHDGWIVTAILEKLEREE